MPQLDLIIVFPQIFWLFITFFLTYTIIIHFFLPLFIKSIKVRKCIVIENNKLLANTQKKIDIKQKELNHLINKNFYLIKLLLEMEIKKLFSENLMLDLNGVDIKMFKALYYNTIYYNINVLDSVLLSPKFSNLRFES